MSWPMRLIYRFRCLGLHVALKSSDLHSMEFSQIADRVRCRGIFGEPIESTRSYAYLLRPGSVHASEPASFRNRDPTCMVSSLIIWGKGITGTVSW